MKKPIKDLLGHELCIGDRCIYTQNDRTRPGPARKIVHVGEITDISKSTVTFQNIIVIDGKIKVFSGDDVIKFNCNCGAETDTRQVTQSEKN